MAKERAQPEGGADERLRVVCISDTHGGNSRLEIPDGDIAIFAGDVTRHDRREEVRDFDAFLGDLPHEHKIVVAGNHDLFFEERPAETRTLLSNATYLCDERLEIEGVTIYGSPWQPRLVETVADVWAFDLPRGAQLARKWAAIPEEVDLLVTHSPPHGIRDEIYTGDAIGCRELRERLNEVRPDVHVFGHVHEHPGVETRGGILFVNASSPGGYGSPALLEYAPRTGEVEVLEAGDDLPGWMRRRMRERAAQHGE